MRAVHVLRSNFREAPGGDIVQLHATVKALAASRVDTVAATIDELASSTDIVHLYNLDDPEQLDRAFATARRRCPGAKIVLTPIFMPWDLRSVARSRDPWISYAAARHAAHVRRHRSTLQRALTRADLLVAGSNIEVERCSAAMGMSQQNLPWEVVRNGAWVAEWRTQRTETVRAALRERLGVPEGVRAVVACAARLEPRKNQRALVRAVDDLGDVALVLAGPVGVQRYADRVLRSARRLSQSTVWIGALDQSELRCMYGAVDLHVLPSFRECAAISTIEAAAAGCGIVEARSAAAEEYFADLGEYCDAWSSASIADAIDKALLRSRGPELQSTARDWMAAGTEMAALYDRCLGGA